MQAYPENLIALTSFLLEIEPIPGASLMYSSIVARNEVGG